MKRSDAVKLHELGLISAEQRQKIIATLNLKEETGRLLLVLSTLGAGLVVSGIILLISANWEAIPAGIKIAVGLLLMLAAWGGGWFLREAPGQQPKTGETLYLVGAGLWLANIALIGQVYHLSSRLPNAFLLWAAGIVALPWILRSKALFVLSLLSVGVWLGTEANCDAGLLGGDWNQSQLALYGLCGLLVLALGYVLRRGAWSDFAVPAEKTGLVVLLLATYPFCWKYLGYWSGNVNAVGIGVTAAISLGAFGLLWLGLLHPRLELTRQWRWTWGATLAGLGGLLWFSLATSHQEPHAYYHDEPALGRCWLVTVGLFVACLLQVEVGVALRSKFMVNLAVTMIGLVLVAAYIDLFDTMATTGWMFLVSGLFLLGFGLYLERKRRRSIARIRSEPTPNPAPAT
jgi:uncharacterized membrane protein